MRATEIHNAAEWEKILATLPNPHPLQSWTWGAFKARWGWQMLPTAWYESAGETAVAAAMLLKRPIPRTPFCILYVPKGPVFDYADGNRAALLAALERLAATHHAIFVKLDPDVLQAEGEEPQPITTGQQFVAELTQRGWRFSDDQIQFRNTVTLDLTQSEEEILANMKSKMRYNIRLAGRKEVVVRRGAVADLPLIYDMYAETADRDGFLIRPRAYYLDIWEAFMTAGMALPLIAEYAGTPLSAVVIVTYGGTAVYMYGASTQQERNRMPNHLLQWEAIRWAQERGCHTYDLWGAPDEFVESDRMWGVWQFKRGFQGRVARHVGAWDFPARQLLYWGYTTAVPSYLSLLKRLRG